MAPTFMQNALLSLALLSSFSLVNALYKPPLRRRAATWVYQGCYTVAARTLTVNVGVQGGPAAMSHENCQAACFALGYILSGTEYSAECWCDTILNNGGQPAPDGNALCSMPCNGNATQHCGGPDRLDLYKYGEPGTSTNAPSSSLPAVTSSTSSSAVPTSSGTGPSGWTALGCYTDSTAARALSINSDVVGGPAAMSIEACITACRAGGYTYSGTEYAGECWCGNALLNGHGPAPDGNAQCTMTCNGNALEICGGPSRLSLYIFGSAPSSTSTARATTSTSVGTTAVGTTSVRPTTTSSVTPVATGLPTNWSYAGCYVDSLAGRIMSGQQADDAQTTVESCVAKCVALGFKVAGIEYGVQCFCDNYLRSDAALATADSQCSMPCPGNTAEKCGAGDRVSVYHTGALVIYHTPVAKTTNLTGNWVYKGCLSDSGNPKTFPRFVPLGQQNSPTTCLAACAKFGYNAAGMEYGTECYCGDVGDVTATGATLQPGTDCYFTCPGDPEALCGAGNRLTYYTWTVAPVTQFTFPQGNAAGKYEFLIGGVIIPLMTQPAINGKVVFLEKWGTGPPNTTGTYELDLASLNNFSRAWRPMHVKTDIFCSAGLTLPDKVGRQLNIGGWSGQSTYGIRLYWPDGSPGVWGVNDWQEDYEQIHLQNGRWYPTAMLMANGSILVVGGENGSNGPAVPTIEILPQVGGVLTMEWLQRTDPYNLYPFLAVLPSGGIFVAYYNEARILNEVTFATTKTLPNMPGSVGNPDGGRTYPLEGTMVLLPQYAPYLDPLGVLICGGSEPFVGGGLGLDNCVTTTPESANPVWTIERMPSSRVMSCMTALPDGTYLILNGAHRGVAGFGLASDANHNAVLYDPTKPVGARMSVMANTTVDRYYHSEAVLLQDGRVMVSGSDPETDGLLQEYRVEVFVPPYLLTGRARPTFTLTNKDWTYGQTVTLTITGSTGALKVSLLGAESSTHGSSMGQRTIFPEATCSGNTCTVKAPPNAHVCPAGWFQVFVLDSGVPSLSQWVRIGGDPGQLGNWPAGLSSFNTPGI
ncbi:hypothetical protein IFR05_009460 [Cadophora sp. M221]|nr:hypothetical protein IFR05_009460 [Cadophora sp. M221]